MRLAAPHPTPRSPRWIIPIGRPFDAATKSPQNQAVAKDPMSFAKGKVKVIVAESDGE
jgi:hypothetical protein